ncbi:hypothetical protein MKS88_000566 [Plasmodium brasilianum]|uniref:Uncharacterized protein n=1 Tax=Plasmodium brasilianum TaxID=5824 RepID=A0ACB9YGZ8_PLABR|nr:hypothetical protein MKS88_000566 [Plasmodium brasilianum]
MLFFPYLLDFFNEKSCYELNYWFYEDLYKNIAYKDEDEKFYKILDFHLSNTFNNDFLCHTGYFLTIIDNFEDLMNFHNFMDNFVVIKIEYVNDDNDLGGFDEYIKKFCKKACTNLAKNYEKAVNSVDPLHLEEWNILNISNETRSSIQMMSSKIEDVYMKLP